MAYDDVLSRTALAVERRSLSEKITSADLAALYRKDSFLADDTIHILRSAIETLARGAESKRALSLKFNKATLFSWLIFLVRGLISGNTVIHGHELGDFLNYFQTTRNRAFHDRGSALPQFGHLVPLGWLFSVYETRASARVADVSSVILRDAVIWLTFEDFFGTRPNPEKLRVTGLDKLNAAFSSRETLYEDDLIAKRLISSGWGNLI
jgi:hypothetical protein